MESALIQAENGLLKFSDEYSKMLFESVANIPDDYKKERLRNAIKKALDLTPKDLVIFKNNDIFVKKWGKDTLIHPGLIQKIKETIQETTSSELKIINNNLIINIQDILSEFGISTTELSNETKEKIKYKLKEQLDISDKDIILFVNDKIVIKRRGYQIEEGVKEEQRYNGLPKEELNKLRKSLFESEEAEQEIFEEITDHIINTELDFKVITHNYFIKNYIKIFQKNIFNLLRENLDENDFVLEGLANLILRENWVLAHTKMALALLELVGQKNPNAEKFLKNYSGEIEIDAERNKFKLPGILDKSGSKWTIPAIITIVMQRQKNIETLNLKQKAINDIKANIEDMYSKIDELNEESVAIEKEFEAIEQESANKEYTEASVNAEIKELREMLKRCKEEERFKIQVQISDKTLLLKKLLIKDDALFTRKKRLEHQSKLIASKKEKLTFDITKLQKKVKEEEEKLAQFIASQKSVDEKFNSLTEALTLALMKRKTKI